MSDSKMLLQASELNVGDFILDDKGKQYEVISNHIGDVIFLLNRESDEHRSSNTYDGFHLFYDDEYSEDSERIARVKFGLELN